MQKLQLNNNEELGPKEIKDWDVPEKSNNSEDYREERLKRTAEKLKIMVNTLLEKHLNENGINKNNVKEKLLSGDLNNELLQPFWEDVTDITGCMNGTIWIYEKDNKGKRLRIKGATGLAKKLLRYLFSVDIRLYSGLNSDNVSQELQQVFKDKGHLLSQSATVKIKEKNRKWIINDAENRREYTVIKEQEILNIYLLGEAKEVFYDIDKENAVTRCSSFF